MTAVARLVEKQPRSSRSASWCHAQLRAMALWPRLDRRALSRCGCDPARLALYISRRTRMPVSAIEKILSD
jgi:hypothetical protein